VETGVQIRVASAKDAEAIAQIIYEAFAPFESFYTGEAFAATTPNSETIRKRFDEKGVIWVVLKGDEIVGTVSVLFEDERLYIRSMAVTTSAQGDGIGRKLLQTIEDFAVENGFKKLFLYTVPFLDGAIRLYEQNGFVRGELETDRFFGTPWFEMTKELRKES
jgi:GNAT superfamily N-acetyltransferase